MFRLHIAIVLSLSTWVPLLPALAGCDSDGRPEKSDSAPPSMDSMPPVDGSRAMPLDSTAPRDAGPRKPDPVPDARVTDATLPGLAPCSGDPPVMKGLDTTTNIEFEPDWSCYDVLDGGSSLPDGGADGGADAGHASTHIMTLGLAPLPAALFGTPTVDVFFVPSTLGAPDVTRTFDTSTVSFPLPVDVDHVSLLLHRFETPMFTVAELHDYGVPAIGGQPLEGFVILEQSRDLAIGSALEGGKADPAKALLISSARDCAGHPVSGARFELVDGETGIPVPTGNTAGLPRSSYTRFAIPLPACTFTTAEQFDATWFLVDAPVNVVDGVKTRPYRVRFEGRRTASDKAPVVLREREVELFAGGITAVRLDR